MLISFFPSCGASTYIYFSFCWGHEWMIYIWLLDAHWYLPYLLICSGYAIWRMDQSTILTVIMSNVLFLAVICLQTTNLPVLILLVKYYDWQGQSSQTILLLQMMLIHILLLKSNHWITGRGRYSFTYIAALPNNLAANEFGSFLL